LSKSAEAIGQNHPKRRKLSLKPSATTERFALFSRNGKEFNKASETAEAAVFYLSEKRL
jgi:hypothetical protein